MKAVVKIINTNFNANLPADPRTLMKTPRSINYTEIGIGIDTGLYWHQGLAFCLRNCFKDLEKNISISININIDGLPLYRSSNKNFWPILFNIQEYPNIRPMALGIFFGESKPSNVQNYLLPFVEEIKPILQNGLELNGHKISISIRCFICDSPARAFVKGLFVHKYSFSNFNFIYTCYITGTMNFNAIEGCQKCTVKGKKSHISNTVVFGKTKQPARTDEMFRANGYPGHVKNETPLMQLPIDMIKDFVVADPLHLLELGVMKRLLVGWRTGNLGYNRKWTLVQEDKISELLLRIKMPREVSRDARTLKSFNLWKGLEFRNFLNYYGIVVLQSHLEGRYYRHFLSLFCAVTICSAEKYLCYLHVAELLFDDFITNYKRIYGVEFITSNVHNLEHVVDDVARYGILSSISAYPFENSLFSIKRMLRAGKHPLVQIANRLTERLFISDFNYKEQNETKPTIIRGKNNKCEVKLFDFTLSNDKFKDMWCYADKKILCMANAVEENFNCFIEGYEVGTCTDFFEKPFKSSRLNIYLADILNIQHGPLKRVDVKNIECKFVAIQHSDENNFVFIPLLHTIKK